jgi:hypothetical protein
VLGGFRKKLQSSIALARGNVVDPEALHRTLEHLSTEGVISAERAAVLRSNLPAQLESSRYVLSHLGAHLGIAAVFAFDLIPLPLGTISRVFWVVGNRTVEQLRGNLERSRVHSLPVLLIAAIPLLGYSAYLLPLRRQSRELAFLLANHAWLVRTGGSYEQFVASSSRPVRRVARWLVPVPG